MAADSLSSADIVVEAGSLIGEHLVGGWSLLESESTVLRARTGSGRSVIIKLVTDIGFDDPGHHGAPQRFLNEWAGLEFLATVGVTDAAPSVVAASAESGLLVLEDLGAHPSLKAVLLHGDGPQARSGMSRFGETLGRLHGATAGHEPGFREVQDRLGTGSPRSDTTVDQRTRRDLFRACFDAAGHSMSTALWRSVVDVEELIHGPSPFRVLTHADSGPQNFLLTPDGGRLIDFEYCVYRNGLTDVAGARLGFPQTVDSMRVPPGDAELLETAYRGSIESRVPECGDDRVFDSALEAACAHWALNRVAAAWRLHVEPRLEALGSLPQFEAERLAKTSLQVEGFAQLAETRGGLEELAVVLRACDSHWRGLWPEIGEVDVYPALRNGA